MKNFGSFESHSKIFSFGSRSLSHSRYACIQHFFLFYFFLFIHFVGCFSAFIIWFVRFVIRFHLINIIIQRSIHFVTLLLQTNLAKNGTTQKKIKSLIFMRIRIISNIYLNIHPIVNFFYYNNLHQTT